MIISRLTARRLQLVMVRHRSRWLVIRCCVSGMWTLAKAPLPITSTRRAPSICPTKCSRIRQIWCNSPALNSMLSNSSNSKILLPITPTTSTQLRISNRQQVSTNNSKQTSRTSHLSGSPLLKNLSQDRLLHPAKLPRVACLRSLNSKRWHDK